MRPEAAPFRPTRSPTRSAPPLRSGGWAAPRAPRWWHRFRRQPSAVVGLALVLPIAFVALAAARLAPGNPLASVGPALQPPSSTYWLGTDDLGRGILAGLLHGARASLFVGLSVALIATIIGVLVGGVAGFFGGWVDDGLMRLTELVQVLPRFFLAILVAALFGGSLLNIVLLLGLTFWPSTARLLRAQLLSLREREFAVAARAVGAAPATVLLRHVLPNALPPVMVNASLQVGGAILIEAGLSFLGLGDRGQVSWGYMLNNAQAFFQLAWWMSVFPGLALLLTVVGVNLVADGLNEAGNPQLAEDRRP
ncbi:MAG: ABC transporter permease [Chloroflexia bacterium]|nr:ABC transporter permease [Chloroflexia bacterium]